jgi:uncharacterized protein (TIGR02001 family)
MSTFKNLTAAAIAAGTLVAVPAMAEVSGNIGLTSNYMFRGTSFSNDDAAISGGLDYAHEDGVYVGTWTSNLGGGTTEVDLYAGFAGEAGEFGYDIGYIQYMYPEQDDWDYGEVYGSVSYDAFEVGFAYTANSEVNEGFGNVYVEGDLYFYGSVGVDLSEDLSLGLTVGNYTFEDDGIGGADFDYSHVQIDVSKGDFTFSLSLADDENDYVDNDDVVPFVSWSKGF